MDLTKAFFVICVTLFIVIGINAAIYVSLRRGKGVGQIELLRRATNTARKPWHAEDEDLKELSDLVSKIQAEHSDDNEKKQGGPWINE